jgi:DNA repair protein RecO (recombination protein O)
MNTYKSQAIVLKRINFGEADKIVTFYTKHFGKVTCLAKGIRRLSSRKRGNLEIFNKITFFANKGKGMDFVTETELLESFSGWRGDLNKVATAYQLCEMVDKLTAEESETDEVYELLAEFLEKLKSLDLEKRSFFLGDFGLKLLTILGYWPKGKPVPKNFRTSVFVEEIIEKELKAKNFLSKIN